MVLTWFDEVLALALHLGNGQAGAGQGQEFRPDSGQAGHLAAVDEPAEGQGVLRVGSDDHLVGVRDGVAVRGACRGVRGAYVKQVERGETVRRRGHDLETDRYGVAAVALGHRLRAVDRPDGRSRPHAELKFNLEDGVSARPGYRLYIVDKYIIRRAVGILAERRGWDGTGRRRGRNGRRNERREGHGYRARPPPPGSIYRLEQHGHPFISGRRQPTTCVPAGKRPVIWCPVYGQSVVLYPSDPARPAYNAGMPPFYRGADPAIRPTVHQPRPGRLSTTLTWAT